MAAYLIVDITVESPDRYQDYVSQAPAFVAKHGGRYLVRGGNAEAREGDWLPERLVILEFPTRANASALLDDPDYQAIAPLRQTNTRSNLIIVDGYDGPQ
jgi:uncharacterized protein (DUF1330 family)